MSPLCLRYSHSTTRIALLSALLVGLASLLACGEPHQFSATHASAPQEPTNSEIESVEMIDEYEGVAIAPWSFELEDDHLESIVAIDDHTVTFLRGNPHLEALDTMDLLVAQHLETQFLRRIQWVEQTDQHLIFHTKDAELNEYLLYGEISSTPSPTPSDIQGDVQQLQQGIAGLDEIPDHLFDDLDFEPFPRRTSGNISLDFTTNFELRDTEGHFKFYWNGSWYNPFPEHQIPKMCQELERAFGQTSDPNDARRQAHVLLWARDWAGSRTEQTICLTDNCTERKRQSDEFTSIVDLFVEGIEEGSISGWDTANMNWENYHPYPTNSSVPSRAQQLSYILNVRNRLPTNWPIARRKLTELYLTLRDNYTVDELAWLSLAPQIAKRGCQGETANLELGAGLDVQFDYRPAVKITVATAAEYAEALDFLVFPIPIAVGPLVLILKFKIELKASAKIEYSNWIEFSLAQQQAHIAFYHGFTYTRGQGFTWKTLEDITNNSQKTVYNLVGCQESSNTTTQCSDWGVKAGGREFKGTASLSLGPQVELSIMGTLEPSITIAATAKAEAGVGAQINANGLEACANAELSVGAKITAGGKVSIPYCPFDSCEFSAAFDILDTCANNTLLPWCPKWNPKLCFRSNDSATTAGSSGGGPTSSTLPTSVSSPPGANDVPGHYELDAIFIQRGNTRILPVEIDGIQAGQCTPDRGTVERGCPELLWAADFTECDPDAWADHVALIPDLNNFRVRFREELQEDDILHVIRQAVPANELNEDGFNCAASGNASFFLGIINPDGTPASGDEPVAANVFNSVSVRIDDEHLSSSRVDPENQYWSVFPDEDTFGAWDPNTNAPAE